MNRPLRFTLAPVLLAALCPAAAFSSPLGSQAEPKYTRTNDVIYGHRDGHALLMDVFTPKGGGNGAGVIMCVSAEYKSERNLLDGFGFKLGFHPLATTPFLDRGYVVFAVMHSSQPRYTVPEAVADVHRAVRFVKANAKKYGVSADKIGISGGSSGGHLALMMGCAGKPGDPAAKDPVERESSKIAAVACFFPLIDFTVLPPPKDLDQVAPFDFREFNKASGKLELVTAARWQEIGRSLSPLTHAGKGAAPTLIHHGDKDEIVPITQSRDLIDKFKKCDVECVLKERKGQGHMWIGFHRDIPEFADWFDRHLLKK